MNLVRQSFSGYAMGGAMTLKRKDTPESREHWDYAERVTREVEAEIEAERGRGKCRCGQFDMPDAAMKIEARGYSVHARHKCSWGQRDAPEVAKGAASQLLRYLSNCNGEPQLLAITEIIRSALLDVSQDGIARSNHV